eukprot:scaffold221014_cov23-Tisochrysis_lutea.AAC.1
MGGGERVKYGKGKAREWKEKIRSSTNRVLRALMKIRRKGCQTGQKNPAIARAKRRRKENVAAALCLLGRRERRKRDSGVARVQYREL